VKTIKGETSCPAKDGTSKRTTIFEKSPPMCIDTSAKYKAIVDTTRGRMTFELNTEKAPKTVNNFVTLARYHAYDGAPFHRIIKNFMIQGGDPNGDPNLKGSVGYTIAEEPPAAKSDYKRGSLAMAKTSAPSSTGSQFFVMGVDDYGLPPEYSLFGQLTEGLEVLDAIRNIPTIATGESADMPTEAININTVTIKESK
jgi:cyclophilin family peptidyl-prolyl cis-trans isomerase